MNEKSLRFALKHLCYAVSMLVLFTLQTTPGLFELWGVKPILVVPFAVCIAALEGEFIGGLYGALAGLLCDLAGSWVFGFHAILCLCCNVAVGLAAIYLVRRSLGSVMLLSLGVLLLTQLLGYFFHYAIWGYEGVSLILWRHTLPVIAYSVLATLPLYYYTAWLEAKFPQQD